MGFRLAIFSHLISPCVAVFQIGFALYIFYLYSLGFYFLSPTRSSHECKCILDLKLFRDSILIIRQVYGQEFYNARDKESFSR